MFFKVDAKVSPLIVILFCRHYELQWLKNCRLKLIQNKRKRKFRHTTFSALLLLQNLFEKI